MPLLRAGLMHFDDDEPSSTQPDTAPSASDQTQPQIQAESRVHTQIEGDGDANTAHVLDTQSENLIDVVRADISAAQHRSRLALADIVYSENRRIMDTLQAALNRRYRSIMDTARAVHEQDLESLDELLRSTLCINVPGEPIVLGVTAEEQRRLSHIAARAQGDAARQLVRDVERNVRRRAVEESVAIERRMVPYVRQIERGAEDRRREAEERGAGAYLPPRH